MSAHHAHSLEVLDGGLYVEDSCFVGYGRFNPMPQHIAGLPPIKAFSAQRKQDGEVHVHVGSEFYAQALEKPLLPIRKRTREALKSAWPGFDDSSDDEDFPANTPLTDERILLGLVPSGDDVNDFGEQGDLCDFVVQP